MNEMNAFCPPQKKARSYPAGPMVLNLILGVLILEGCALFGGNQHSWRQIPIGDVNMVAGEWNGTVRKDHSVVPEGTVDLVVRNNATYLFMGQTVSDTVLGSGFLKVRDGMLIGDTDRRTLTLTLYDHAGKEVLLVEAHTKATGTDRHGQFHRVRSR
jgi:hypothetical protein